jgi:hypothetical protein
MKVFNSNTKKITKVVPKTNITKLDGATFANKLVSDYLAQSASLALLDGKDDITNLTGSLLASLELNTSKNYDYESSFDSRVKTTFNNKTKVNTNPIKINKSEKDLVLGFRRSILDITANSIFREPDVIEILDDRRIKLIFNNVYLQAATEINDSNFDVYVNGVRVPTYMTIEHSETGVHLIINEFIGINSDNKDRTNIYVKGKFLVI